MANPWPTRRDNIPSTSNEPSLEGQWQKATRTDLNSSIHGCSCSLCSNTRRNHQASANRSSGIENRWLPGAPDVLYANRIMGIDDPTDIADVNGPLQVAQVVAPQTLWNQENPGIAPLHQAAGPFQGQTNVDIDQTLVPDMTVTESLRRLAGRYVDNPESLVNAVRLEPGSSGRFLVIIMLETADIL